MNQISAQDALTMINAQKEGDSVTSQEEDVKNVWKIPIVSQILHYLSAVNLEASVLHVLLMIIVSRDMFVMKKNSSVSKK